MYYKYYPLRLDRYGWPEYLTYALQLMIKSDGPPEFMLDEQNKIMNLPDKLWKKIIPEKNEGQHNIPYLTLDPQNCTRELVKNISTCNTLIMTILQKNIEEPIADALDLAKPLHTENEDLFSHLDDTMPRSGAFNDSKNVLHYPNPFLAITSTLKNVLRPCGHNVKGYSNVINLVEGMKTVYDHKIKNSDWPRIWEASTYSNVPKQSSEALVNMLLTDNRTVLKRLIVWLNKLLSNSPTYFRILNLHELHNSKSLIRMKAKLNKALQMGFTIPDLAVAVEQASISDMRGSLNKIYTHRHFLDCPSDNTTTSRELFKTYVEVMTEILNSKVPQHSDVFRIMQHIVLSNKNSSSNCLNENNLTHIRDVAENTVRKLLSEKKSKLFTIASSIASSLIPFSTNVTCEMIVMNKLKTEYRKLEVHINKTLQITQMNANDFVMLLRKTHPILMGTIIEAFTMSTKQTSVITIVNCLNITMTIQKLVESKCNSDFQNAHELVNQLSQMEMKDYQSDINSVVTNPNLTQAQKLNGVNAVLVTLNSVLGEDTFTGTIQSLQSGKSVRFLRLNLHGKELTEVANDMTRYDMAYLKNTEELFTFNAICPDNSSTIQAKANLFVQELVDKFEKYSNLNSDIFEVIKLSAQQPLTIAKVGKMLFSNHIVAAGFGGFTATMATKILTDKTIPSVFQRQLLFMVDEYISIKPASIAVLVNIKEELDKFNDPYNQTGILFAHYNPITTVKIIKLMKHAIESDSHIYQDTEVDLLNDADLAGVTKAVFSGFGYKVMNVFNRRLLSDQVARFFEDFLVGFSAGVIQLSNDREEIKTAIFDVRQLVSKRDVSPMMAGINAAFEQMIISDTGKYHDELSNIVSEIHEGLITLSKLSVPYTTTANPTSTNMSTFTQTETRITESTVPIIATTQRNMIAQSIAGEPTLSAMESTEQSMQQSTMPSTSTREESISLAEKSTTIHTPTAEQSTLPDTSSDERSTMITTSAGDQSTMPETSSAEKSTIPATSSVKQSTAKTISTVKESALPDSSSGEQSPMEATSTADQSTTSSTSLVEQSTMPDTSSAKKLTTILTPTAEQSTLPPTSSDEPSTAKLISTIRWSTLPDSSSVEQSTTKSTSTADQFTISTTSLVEQSTMLDTSSAEKSTTIPTSTARQSTMTATGQSTMPATSSAAQSTKPTSVRTEQSTKSSTTSSETRTVTHKLIGLHNRVQALSTETQKPMTKMTTSHARNNKLLAIALPFLKNRIASEIREGRMITPMVEMLKKNIALVKNADKIFTFSTEVSDISILDADKSLAQTYVNALLDKLAPHWANDKHISKLVRNMVVDTKSLDRIAKDLKVEYPQGHNRSASNIASDKYKQLMETPNILSDLILAMTDQFVNLSNKLIKSLTQLEKTLTAYQKTSGKSFLEIGRQLGKERESESKNVINALEAAIDSMSLPDNKSTLQKYKRAVPDPVDLQSAITNFGKKLMTFQNKVIPNTYLNELLLGLIQNALMENSLKKYLEDLQASINNIRNLAPSDIGRNAALNDVVNEFAKQSKAISNSLNSGINAMEKQEGHGPNWVAVAGCCFAIIVVIVIVVLVVIYMRRRKILVEELTMETDDPDVSVRMLTITEMPSPKSDQTQSITDITQDTEAEHTDETQMATMHIKTGQPSSTQVETDSTGSGDVTQETQSNESDITQNSEMGSVKDQSKTFDQLKTQLSEVTSGRSLKTNKSQRSAKENTISHVKSDQIKSDLKSTFEESKIVEKSKMEHRTQISQLSEMIGNKTIKPDDHQKSGVASNHIF